MSLKGLKIIDCKCGNSVLWILQNVVTRKWHIQCYACHKKNEDCKTKRHAILAWNGMNR